MSHLSDLIAYADSVRQKMEAVVAETDTKLEICPGWTIKEAIGHITAWEIAIHKAILAYKAGDPPYFLPEQDFDLFNQGAVSLRADWPFDDVIKEWRTVRDQLRDTILSLDENDLEEELVLPWGSERTMAELIEILGEHEGEHLENIIKSRG
ncbi:MAG: DinB family protein [Anaerolineales bacterium]